MLFNVEHNFPIKMNAADYFGDSVNLLRYLHLNDFLLRFSSGMSDEDEEQNKWVRGENEEINTGASIHRYTRTHTYQNCRIVLLIFTQFRFLYFVAYVLEIQDCIIDSQRIKRGCVCAFGGGRERESLC